jgi:hypothetical protein
MTYASSAREFAANTHVLKLQWLQNRFSAPLAIFQGTHWSVNRIRLSIFRYIFMIILQNYAGKKQKLYKIMKIQMSAI